MNKNINMTKLRKKRLYYFHCNTAHMVEALSWNCCLTDEYSFKVNINVVSSTNAMGSDKISDYRKMQLQIYTHNFLLKY